MNDETRQLIEAYGIAIAAYWNQGFMPLVSGTGDWQYFDAQRRINTLIFRALLTTDKYDPQLEEDAPPYPGHGCGVCFEAGDLKQDSELHVFAARYLEPDAHRHLRDRYPVSGLSPQTSFEFLDFYNPGSAFPCENQYIIARVVEDSPPLAADSVVVIDACTLLGDHSSLNRGG